MQNPWSSIWTKPRSTIRSIVATNPRRGFFILATIFGLSITLSQSIGMAISFDISITTAVLAAIVLSPFIGALFLYVGAWILWGVGKWFNGQAPYRHVLAAYSWSKLPTVIIDVMWFLLITIGGVRSVLHYTQDASISFVIIITLIAQIWALVLLIHNLQEVQNFSFWKAFGNWITATIVYLSVLVFTSFLIGSILG